MENLNNPVEQVDVKPEWETPQLTVETVAAATQFGFNQTDLDAASGS